MARGPPGTEAGGKAALGLEGGDLRREGDFVKTLGVDARGEEDPEETVLRMPGLSALRELPFLPSEAKNPMDLFAIGEVGDRTRGEEWFDTGVGKCRAREG
jgi:hypothetical protein